MLVQVKMYLRYLPRWFLFNFMYILVNLSVGNQTNELRPPVVFSQYLISWLQWIKTQKRLIGMIIGEKNEDSSGIQETEISLIVRNYHKTRNEAIRILRKNNGSALEATVMLENAAKIWILFLKSLRALFFIEDFSFNSIFPRFILEIKNYWNREKMRKDINAPFYIKYGFSILAASCSEMVTYPLDLAKTRLQVTSITKKKS